MQKELEKGLMDIGFEQNDAKVFVELAGLRSATAGEIAKSRGMARRCVYDSLERLAKKGLVAYVLKDGVKRYQPADFGILAEIAKKKEKEVSFVVSSIIPRLESFRKTAEEESPVEVYIGPAGIKSILAGALDFAKGKEIIGYGDNGKIGGQLIPRFMEKWHQRRIANGIRIRSIFINTESSIKVARKASRIKMMKVRMMPTKSESNLGVWVCGERAVIWVTTGNPIAISIANREVADGFRKQFDYLWKNAKEIR